MSDVPPLVLPAGAEVRIGGNTLVLRHAGDILLEQTFGRRLVRLESDGDVTLRCDRVSGTILAKGRVEVLAEADAEEIRGDVVVLGDVPVRARAIVATSKVVIGAATLTVDVIIAPIVEIHPDATGRVRVVDCDHDIPASRIRGCLSLADYESDFGNVAEFLARRGVEPLHDLPHPAGATRDDDEHAADDLEEDAFRTLDVDVEALAVEIAKDAPEEDPAEDPDATMTVMMSAPEEADVSATVEAAEDPVVAALPRNPAVGDLFTDDDDVIDALASDAFEAIDDEPSIAPPTRGPSRAQRQVGKAWERLQAAYPNDQMPQAVIELGQLVEEGRYEEVTESVDVFWRETLREHIQRGAPPPRRATLAFHGIRAVAA